jgi:hypothetical protein
MPLPPSYPPYPKVVKVEERRAPKAGSPIPICRQVEIVEDGPAIPALDQKGETIEIQIEEVIPDEKKKEADPYVFRRHFPDRHQQIRGEGGSEGDELSDCGCIWWTT